MSEDNLPEYNGRAAVREKHTIQTHTITATYLERQVIMGHGIEHTISMTLTTQGYKTDALNLAEFLRTGIVESHQHDLIGITVDTNSARRAE